MKHCMKNKIAFIPQSMDYYLRLRSIDLHITLLNFYIRGFISVVTIFAVWLVYSNRMHAHSKLPYLMPKVPFTQMGQEGIHPVL